MCEYPHSKAHQPLNVVSWWPVYLLEDFRHISPGQVEHRAGAAWVLVQKRRDIEDLPGDDDPAVVAAHVRPYFCHCERVHREALPAMGSSNEGNGLLRAAAGAGAACRVGSWAAVVL